MIKRVIFMGDLWRGDQASNVARIERLFSPVLKQLGVTSSNLITEINRQDSLNEWLDIWKESLISSHNSALEAIDFEGIVVIGFEVPERDLQYLDQHGVPWINIAIHPIRFLDDLYFEVSTSFVYDLQQHAASLGQIELCVQALRTRYPAQATSHLPRTLAIFGQTPIDKSVYFDGRFHKLDSYFSQLDELVKRHDSVIFKPHPYLTDSETDKLICERYKATLNTGWDVYELFVTGGITTACAISSSLITEAPYFNITGEFLEPRAKKFGPPISYKCILDDQKLWRRLLGLDAHVDEIRISQAVPANFLRKVFASWGYLTDDQYLEARLTAKQDGFLQAITEQAKSRVSQAEARAQQAEERAQIEACRAQQAETRAQQAETRAQQAETRAQQAEERAQQAEERAQQAEERAQQAEERAQQAEERAQIEACRVEQAETRAQQAEARVQQEFTRKEQVEENARAMEQRVVAAEAAAYQAGQQVNEWHDRVLALHNSTCWKITKPIRALGRILQWQSTVAEVSSVSSAHLKLFVRARILSSIKWAVDRAQASAGFKRVALRLLRRHPILQQKLRKIYLENQYREQPQPVNWSGTVADTIMPVDLDVPCDREYVISQSVPHGINANQRTPLESSFMKYFDRP